MKVFYEIITCLSDTESVKRKLLFLNLLPSVKLPARNHQLVLTFISSQPVSGHKRWNIYAIVFPRKYFHVTVVTIFGVLHHERAILMDLFVSYLKRRFVFFVLWLFIHDNSFQRKI